MCDCVHVDARASAAERLATAESAALLTTAAVDVNESVTRAAFSAAFSVSDFTKLEMTAMRLSATLRVAAVCACNTPTTEEQHNNHTSNQSSLWVGMPPPAAHASNLVR